MPDSACQSRREFIEEAGARAKRWGYPAVKIVHDVVYVEYGERQLRADVYMPPKSDQKRPFPASAPCAAGLADR